MGRLVSLMTRVTALIGLMAALPGLTHVAQVGNHATRAGAAATSADSGNPLLGDSLAALTGGGFDLHSLNLSSASNLFDLLDGDGGSSLKSKSKRTPSQPSTFIHYVAADKKHGGYGRSDVVQLPPGANVAVVDGQVQLYYPTSKPKKAQ